MEYANWDEGSSKAIPLPNDDFDQFFTGYNEIDNLFNETLAGLSDLDVPSGFANQGGKNSNQNSKQFSSSSSPSTSSPHHRKHSRKISGTAIFGYTDHGKSLSINGTTIQSASPTPQDMGYKLNAGKGDPVMGASVSPGQLLKSSHNMAANLQHLTSSPGPSDFILAQHPLEDDEQDEFGDEKESSMSPSRRTTLVKSTLTSQTSLAEAIEEKPKEGEDFIVTNETPKAYKFPPSPIDSKQAVMNSFTAKYLQEFSQNNIKVEYVDDIEPLLDEEPNFDGVSQSSPFNNHKANQKEALRNEQSNGTGSYKFVPIPVQTPKAITSTNNLNTKNVFLPPPSPPTLSNGSPDWSSPEPQSPSPSRVYNGINRSSASLQPPSVPHYNNNSNNPNFSSPVHPQISKNFYTPQFFSDNNPVGYIEQGSANNLAYQSPEQPQHLNLQQSSPLHHQQSSPQHPQQLQQYQLSEPPVPQQLHSSPIHLQHQQQQQQQQNQHQHQHNLPSSPIPTSINSSPVRYYSPLRNVAANNDNQDDSIVDINATIVQLTPLKDQFQNTPNRNSSRLDLKWSPVISPNAKSSKDVRKAIQQFTPKRKIEKTSLLPPGELDQYWEGPDENKVYVCTYNGCGKKFTRRYNVRSHIQTHLSDRPFACAYCPKKFVRQHDLNRHVKGHQEARYCKCPCGKEFARLDAMRKHRARNICVGGVASNENHCVVKPKRKSSQLLMDGFASEMLSDELTGL